MATAKTLFLLILSAWLAGCSSIQPAPVADAVPLPAADPAPRASDTRPEPAMAAPAASASLAEGAKPQPGAALSPEALFVALSALGTDYRRGGKAIATGFDCSGLVAHVYAQAYGLKLPHNARAQSERGKPVPVESLTIGDLVFYNTLGQPFSHVGIYVGDGRFLHAPKPGAVVRTESMRAAYWTKRCNGARRLGPTVWAQSG